MAVVQQLISSFVSHEKNKEETTTGSLVGKMN